MSALSSVPGRTGGGRLSLLISSLLIQDNKGRLQIILLLSSVLETEVTESSASCAQTTNDRINERTNARTLLSFDNSLFRNIKFKIVDLCVDSHFTKRERERVEESKDRKKNDTQQ